MCANLFIQVFFGIWMLVEEDLRKRVFFHQHPYKLSFLLGKDNYGGGTFAHLTFFVTSLK